MNSRANVQFYFQIEPLLPLADYKIKLVSDDQLMSVKTVNSDIYDGIKAIAAFVSQYIKPNTLLPENLDVQVEAVKERLKSGCGFAYINCPSTVA